MTREAQPGQPNVSAGTASAARPRRRRKASRAGFGSVRKLPSGRYQARYSDNRMNRYTAPGTFETKRQAEDWLATTRADMVRGTWRAPELSAVTLANYAADHLAMRLDLAPATRELYASVLRNWITAPLAFPPAQGRRSRTITLGDAELGQVSVSSVREWYAAALHTARTNALTRSAAASRARTRDPTHHARAWAKENGHPIKATGRLPQAVLDGWQAAGSPAARSLEQPAPPTSVNAGRAQVAQAYRLLRMLLQHAVTEGRLQANPCQIPGAGHVTAPERVPATLDQITGLADAMPARYAAAVHVAAWSGLRAGKLFGFARRHVGLNSGTVRVERAVCYVSGRRPFLGGTKTDSSRRTVHLPPHVVDLLRKQNAAAEKRRKAADRAQRTCTICAT